MAENGRGAFTREGAYLWDTTAISSLLVPQSCKKGPFGSAPYVSKEMGRYLK